MGFPGIIISVSSSDLHKPLSHPLLIPLQLVNLSFHSCRLLLLFWPFLRREEYENVNKMASQSQGIQQLLQAEKRAAEKVAEARKRKNRRLKQAKEEAQAEIEQYRLQREKEFKSKEAAALGSHGNSAVEVERETVTRMAQVQSGFGQNREAVLTSLLAAVCDIRPEIHANYRVAG